MTLEKNLKFCYDFMVAIDTNCFENYDEDKSISPYCASVACNEFFKNRKSRSEYSMGHYFITESVFGEILQQRREYFQRAVENLNKALKPFGKEADIPDDINFEAGLRKYLDDNDIEILPHPGNEIFPKVIQRALEKKLPFKPVNENRNNKNNGSDKGFKDVLLWETLLNFDYKGKRIGKIFLITANSKDFPIDELLPEWKKIHPDVELSILQNWPDFIKEEEITISELIAHNDIEYSTILRLFQEEDPDIIELPNFKKKLTGRANSPIIEIDADVKTRDGHIYQVKYYYDVRVNEPTLFDPDEYDSEQETADND